MRFITSGLLKLSRWSLQRAFNPYLRAFPNENNQFLQNSLYAISNVDGGDPIGTEYEYAFVDQEPISAQYNWTGTATVILRGGGASGGDAGQGGRGGGGGGYTEVIVNIVKNDTYEWTYTKSVNQGNSVQFAGAGIRISANGGEDASGGARGDVDGAISVAARNSGGKGGLSGNKGGGGGGAGASVLGDGANGEDGSNDTSTAAGGIGAGGGGSGGAGGAFMGVVNGQPGSEIGGGGGGKAAGDHLNGSGAADGFAKLIRLT